jgi:oxaloacetate decarboxylase alpha subunit
MNVMAPERYAQVPDEVIRYFLGHFGAPPAPVDPEVADRVLSRPRARELAAVRPRSLEGARQRCGPRMSEEELLVRLTMPAEQVDAIRRDGPAPLAAARPGRAPLVTLLAELARRPDVTYARVAKDDDVVVWRRAA